MEAKRLILILIVAMTGLTAIAQTTRPTAPAAGARKSVGMKSMTFAPASVNIKVGDAIVWTNDDDRDHTVVSGNATFKSDNLRPGGSFSHTFTKAGTFTYTCTYHPRMKGTIVVTDK